MKRGLEACGAVVDTMIPHRMKDGYGLNEHLVDEAYADGIDTILTCDNGIAAYAQIEQAKKYGMTVIITDHHEIPYEEDPLAEPDPETGETSRRRYKIPPADVVIDPKQPGDTYPFQEICGAVVAFKLMQLLFAEFGFDGISTDLTSGKRSLLDELLEFAAFATICDVMPLREENRILVRHGLELMKQTQNVGLHALMGGQPDFTLAGWKAGGISYRLCARSVPGTPPGVYSAQRAMELLDSKTREAAVAQAAFLKQLNYSRKMMEEYVKIAVEMIESGPLKDDRVLVVFLPDCHESIAGIIAGRIRERYYRPTFVLTRGGEGVKGSARSIEGYHMYEEMTKCSSFFTKYGGHKMAAGLSMREEDVEPFRQKINEICTLTEDDLQTEKIHIDVPMPVSYVSFRLVEELELLEPFGTGNPKPVFAQKDLKFVSARALGKAGNVLRFTVEDSEQKRWEMMYFGGKDNFEAYAAEKYGQTALDGLYSGKGSPLYFDVVYYPGVNTWQGNTKLQLVMQQYR